MTKYKKIIYILSIMVAIMNFILGTLLLRYSLDNKVLYATSYNECNNIDYLVYLKDNNFFEEKYLEKDKTYITSLIDYIYLNYSYNLKFDEETTGTYSYKINATVKANKVNEQGYYWKKVYEIESDENIEFTDSFAITNNQKIDYDKYNKVLEEFKKEYGLNVDGILEIELEVNTNAINKTTGENKVEGKSLISIPLSQLAIDATISTNTDGNCIDKTITKETTSNDKCYLIAKIFSIVFYLMSISLIIKLIFEIRKEKEIHQYEYTLNKILTNYDSVIVTVKGDFNESKLHINYVSSFSELMDAHSEVRLPINYYEIEKNKLSKFVLINGKSAWVYILDATKLKKGKKNERK